MSAWDWAQAILGVGSAYASYQAGQSAAQAARHEAAYNIYAAQGRIKEVTGTIPIRLRTINDITRRQALVREFAKHTRASAGVFAGEAAAHNAASGAHLARAGASLERAEAHLAGAEAQEAQAVHATASAGLIRERAGLTRQEAALTDEAALLQGEKSALSLMAAKAGEIGIDNTVFNAEIQEYLAERAIFEGNFDAETVRISTRRAKGAVLANAAARGVQVGSGSSAAIGNSVTFMGQREESKIIRAAENRALSHEVKSRNLRDSIYGQEVNVAAHELASEEHLFAQRRTALGAEIQRFQAVEQEHAAEGKLVQAQAYRAGAVSSRAGAASSRADAASSRAASAASAASARSSLFQQAGALLRARDQQLSADALNTQIADQQRQIGSTLLEIDNLNERQKLFETQGKLGARAGSIQGFAGAATALGGVFEHLYTANQ